MRKKKSHVRLVIGIVTAILLLQTTMVTHGRLRRLGWRSLRHGVRSSARSRRYARPTDVCEATYHCINAATLNDPPGTPTPAAFSWKTAPSTPGLHEETDKFIIVRRPGSLQIDTTPLPPQKPKLPPSLLKN